MSTSLIAVFVRHRLLANLLMAGMLILGVISLTRMNIQFFPTFALDVISVRVVWSGASAEDVENGILIPLEERLKTVDGLKKLTATAAQGIASLSVELQEDTDPLLALDQVRQRVDEFRNLPKDAETPQISRISRYESVARLLVSGPSLAELRPWVRQFERELLARGIDRVDISGLPEERIAIEVPGRALETLGLSLDGIGEQIGRIARDLPSGIAGEADGARELRSLEQRRDPLAFEDLAIVSDERALVRLGDVATIVREARPASLTLAPIPVGLNAEALADKPATVELLVQRAEQGHSLKAARLFDDWLNDTRPTLPPAIELTVFDAQWEVIADRIDLLIHNGLQGLTLVLIMLFIFLPGRVAFWVAMGIPVAYMAALALLWAFGGTINMMSLFGLLLTLGIIDDDAIVVGEHAETRFRQGLSPAEAALSGAQRMFWPILASGLTTIAAFLPLMLVGGIMGNILGDIPFVAIMVLLASLLEVFLVMPMHLRSAFEHHKDATVPRWRERVNAGFDRFRDGVYRPLVVWALHWRGVTVSVVAVLMLLAIGLLIGGRVSFVFFPTPESQVVFANATFVAGTPREQTTAFLDELERALIATDEQFGGGLIESAVARLGATVAVDVGAGAGGDQLASILVQLVPSEYRAVRNEQFLAAWRANTRMPAGLESLVISARRAGPPGRDLTIRLMGDEANRLKSAALELAQSLESVPGVSDMVDDMPFGREQLIYRLTPAGQALGFTTESLGRQLRAAFDGYLAQLVQVGQDELEVRVLLPRAERVRLNALEQLLVRTPDGRFVPLTTVAAWETQRGFEALRHADGRLAVEVSADIDRALATPDNVREALERDLLPRLVSHYGIDYSFEGRAADQRETLGDMRLGLILGLALIYMILAAVFGSWGWPLVVMTAIPLGLVGAIGGHWLLGLDLTLLSLFGLFGLSGIVVNNAIILVSMYHELREEGMAVDEALVEAAVSRLRAMLLTSATTVVGLGPLIFETSLQAQFLIPMAVSLAFGVGFSTVLVLVFTPALLSLHESAHGRLAALWKWLQDDTKSDRSGRPSRTVS
ncbi:efflux RND transporter permease subunit [Allochromatium humboldtianum]|uniref:Efflux RND transporter permease subunit n=1 Tax=Allochromatium humboldtianum TaxID=504901 RepID=A0A850RLI7_9GAMM|nr:efflux RND transporter permease subunit [Allochromatium humboldtianum]NVZ09823.1 efflux RND transporter permease subunit [Allochromatium humboldtianum]